MQLFMQPAHDSPKERGGSNPLKTSEENRIDVQSFIDSNRCKNKKARDEEHISKANVKDLDQARGSAFRLSGDFDSLPLLIDEKKPDSHRKGSTMDEKKCEKEREKK
ncbi:unnamed protein product, partial [Sphenostylis stenocarpa]